MASVAGPRAPPAEGGVTSPTWSPSSVWVRTRGDVRGEEASSSAPSAAGGFGSVEGAVVGVASLTSLAICE